MAKRRAIDLTLAMLRQIRDGIASTNQRLEGLERTTAERFESLERTTSERFKSLERTMMAGFGILKRDLDALRSQRIEGHLDLDRRLRVLERASRRRRS